MPSEGISWLQEETTTAAWCWKLTLKNGTVLGFTSHDRNLTVGGVTYSSASGFTPTAVETTNNMSVDNLDVEGFLSSDAIKADDLEAGVYDGAKVEIIICDWINPDNYPYTLRSGFLGEVEHTDTGFKAEVRGLLDVFQQNTAQKYQKTCRAILGDSKCKFPLESQGTTSGTITGINTDGSFTTTNSTEDWPDGFFDYGVVTFTSGSNTGKSYEVKKFLQSNKTMSLFMPTYYEMAIGDTFKLTIGCDGNFSTCKDKFRNAVNFRGEPHVPGTDYVASYALKGSSNTVANTANAKRT